MIVVLGCGGDRDRAKRPLMGAAAARLADVAVLTSDNPRSEEPAEIVAAMLEGAMSVASAHRAEIIVELDRRSAIEAAVTRARHGDVVVVAGKGHEQGQEVAATVLPFDDRDVLRDSLSALVGRTIVIPLSIAEIAEHDDGHMSDVADPALRINGPVVADSRAVVPGALFVALPGARYDGHDFAARAVADGAALVLANRSIGVPAVVVDDTVHALGRFAHRYLASLAAPLVVGITGSSGKTSTKDMTAQLLAELGPTVAPEGSFNTEVGLPLTVLRARDDHAVSRAGTQRSRSRPHCLPGRDLLGRVSASCSTSARPM